MTFAISSASATRSRSPSIRRRARYGSAAPDKTISRTGIPTNISTIFRASRRRRLRLAGVRREPSRLLARARTAAQTVEPLVELPAYSTIIGATFYPRTKRARTRSRASIAAALFAAAHGSWHIEPPTAATSTRRTSSSCAMNGDVPVKPVDWNDPTTQWTRVRHRLSERMQRAIGRPTGIAVGPKGSLFIGDDQNG